MAAGRPAQNSRTLAHLAEHQLLKALSTAVMYIKPERVIAVVELRRLQIPLSLISNILLRLSQTPFLFAGTRLMTTAQHERLNFLSLDLLTKSKLKLHSRNSSRLVFRQLLVATTRTSWMKATARLENSTEINFLSTFILVTLVSSMQLAKFSCLKLTSSTS